MTAAAKRTIAIVTGTRAEYGLLRPVMHAIAGNESLMLQVWVTGTHLLPTTGTIDEIAREFPIAHRIIMQLPGEEGRMADTAALGRGIAGMADALKQSRPDVVLVLGDRIEAFAAAAAASVSGVRVAHMHGGDRAEGIADEALRHAITKLAHMHLPATTTSAQRIIAMGEDAQRVHVVGSPAIDGLMNMPPLADPQFAALGSPQVVVLLHPVGDDSTTERDRAAELLRAVRSIDPAALALYPNHDPGREGIMQAISESGLRSMAHLERPTFIGLLRRTAVLVGNSSAGLIEAAAIPVHVINLGRRQSGREMPANVADIPDWNYQTLREALDRALATPIGRIDHPYGDGRAGVSTSAVLAEFDPASHPTAKRNSY